MNYREKLDASERIIILDALKASSGNVAAASRLLAVPLRTLWSRIERLEVDLSWWRPVNEKPPASRE
jgi:DNA-binding NtrC family response regulator